MSQYRYYHFDRYRDGKLMAEGAVTKAANEEDAIKKVKSWYPFNTIFQLRQITYSV